MIPVSGHSTCRHGLSESLAATRRDGSFSGWTIATIRPNPSVSNP